MSDASTLRIAAAFSFLSPLTILLGVPAVARLGGAGGPGPIDFGDGAVLDRLAALGTTPMQVDTLALLGPVFALPAAFGWYVLLRPASHLTQLGIVLWYVGMVFVILQDAVQLAFVSALPAAHAAADVATRAALEAVGSSVGYTIEVLAFTGHLATGFGFLLLALVMWRCAAIPKWIAGLGIGSSILALTSEALAFAFPTVGWLAVGVPVGVLLSVVLIAALGVVMLREARRPALLAAPATA